MDDPESKQPEDCLAEKVDASSPTGDDDVNYKHRIKIIGDAFDGIISSLKQHSGDESRIEELRLSNKELKTSNSLLEEEKRSLASILADKREEIKKAHDEYSDLQDVLQDTRKDYSECLKKNRELEQQTLDAELKQSLLEKECEQLKKSNEWLWAQFDEKNKLLTDVQTGKDNEISRMRQELQDLKLEKDSSQSKNNVLHKLVGELETRVKDLMASNSENEAHLISMKGQFQSEINSMCKLCEMYDSDLKVSRKHTESLEIQLSEVSQKLDTLKAESEKKIQGLTEESRFWRAKFDEVYESNEALKLAADTKIPSDGHFEVHNLNILPGRKTYTELYIDYESEKEKRIAAERQIVIYENRLNEAIDHLKAKKEYIIDMEQEKSRTINRNDLLFKKLTQAFKDKKSMVSELESIKMKNSSLETEQAIMKSDINDLIKQIRSLAVQLYRSYPKNIVSVENYVNDLVSRYSSDDGDTYSDIEKEIGEKFVEISTIEDIVRQSFLLRRFCKKIIFDFEKQKDEITSESLDLANSELKRVKESLEEAKSEVCSLQSKLRYTLKQRDDLQEALKKYLTVRGDPDDVQEVIAVNTMSVTSDSETLVESDQRKDIQAKDSPDETFKKLYYDSMKQFDEYMKESGVSVKDLNEKLETLRTENTEKSITIAKLNSQVGFQNEKYSLLLSSFEELKQENLHLREKITSLSLSASTNEEKLQSIIDKLSCERVRASHLEAKILQIQSEKQTWQDSIDRYSNEKKELYEERNKLNDELIELRFRFNDIVNSQKSDKRKYENQILDLKKELNSTRKDLATAKEEKYDVLELKMAELKSAQNDIMSLKVEYEKVKSQVSSFDQEKAGFLAELQKKSARVMELENLLPLYGVEESEDKSQPITPEDRIKKLEYLLVESRKEILEKQDDIASLKQRESTLKELAANSEVQLSEFNASYDLYKADAQRTISKLEDESKKYKEKTDLLNEEIKTLDETLANTENILNTERGNHDKEINTLKSRIKDLEKSEEKSSEFFKKAKSDMDALKCGLESAHERYEKEIMLHSDSLNTIKDLKVSLEQVKEELSERKKINSELEERLSLVDKSAQEIRNRLEDDIKDLEKRNIDLLEHNKILHSQFSALEKTVRSSTHNTILDDAALGDGPEKSICELRELVSFVQRERDVISVKLEVARSENARFASENTHLRSLLDQERARFVAELDRSASRLSSESKHRDIMEKIEQNNILSESNAILRMRLGESEKKAASLTDSIRNITQECQKLKGELVETQAEVEALRNENQQLIKENNSHRNRIEQIIRQQKHIDPQEYEDVKKNLENAEKMYAALQVEKDEVDELIKTMSEKNRQLLLAIKRLEQDIISKTESIDKMTVDLENKSTEIEGLRQQEATLKNKLSEADSKLQVTIQRANATMMQFKDRNKSLFEERKSLEYQLLLMKEKINALQAEGQQSTAEQRADTEIESGPVAPQVLRDVNDTPPPDTTVKTEDLSDAAVPPPQHNLSVREEQRHPVTSDLQTFTTPSRLEAQSSGSLDAHSSTQTAKMALDETAPAPETGQEATAVKQRRTKADLDNLRMKYESLLSQIESSKMSGKLQKSPFSPGVPNTGQDMNRSHLRRSEAFPELTQPIHHHEKGVSSAPVLSGSSDMQVVTDSDEFSANKKFKSALHGSNTSYTHPSVHISRQPPQDFGQSSHSSSVEPPFPIQDTSTHYFEPPEPGEISEFDTVNPQKPPLYVTQGPAVASATRLVDKPLHISSQFSSGQDLPANATRPDSTFLQPGRDSTTARITSLPHKTAPNPDSSRMTQIAKTGPTLTPDQRSQLLKRKLEAAEAKIATPSISTHVGTTSSEDNTQTDTGHNKNNHEST